MRLCGRSVGRDSQLDFGVGLLGGRVSEALGWKTGRYRKHYQSATPCGGPISKAVYKYLTFFINL